MQSIDFLKGQAIHWEMDSHNSSSSSLGEAYEPCCSFPNCNKVFKESDSKLFCYHCHHSYCSIHDGSQLEENGASMLLNKGKFDPLNGIKFRVCQECFLNRPGYN